MGTNTLPSFSAAITDSPWEPKFFVRYPHGGKTYEVGFDTFDDLLHAVTSKKDRYGNPLPTDVVNLIVDFAEESLEWNATPVVAEAVCDCDCRIARLESNERAQDRRLFWALIVIGVVAWFV